MTHPPTPVLTRYAAGGHGLDDAALWSVEVHLDTCPACRAHVAAHTAPATAELLDRVALSLDTALGAGPPPARRRTPAGAVHRRLL
ncbi:zf-HC2 domain-containing protein, partial [Streptomyces fuscigenes]